MKVLIDGQTLLTPEITRGIGTYFKNIVEHLLERDFTNEYYINLKSETELENLSPWARAKLNVLVHHIYQPYTGDMSLIEVSSKRYSDKLNDDLMKHGIDIYFSPNGLMNNVFLPTKEIDCRFAIFVHDLIAIVMADEYINRWPRTLAKWYRAKLKVLEASYDLYLYNSQHTALDFQKALDVRRKKHAVTWLGVSDVFQPSPFPQVYSEALYVLYIGGFDPRKNMDGAVQAFARLHERYGTEPRIQDTQLCIVCHFDDYAKDTLMEQAAQLGIEGKLKLTGFIKEHELLSLYQKAQCLFFPSLYEGFGLPVLEALACGLPVASSRTSSLPEVGGEFSTYFNPCDIDEMAKSLYKTLHEPMDYAARMSRHAYARTFSWQRAAQITLDALTDCASDDQRTEAAGSEP
ncbi:MAG TPA: glycosyltransferase family 1 protein [Pyrinomonadaceae bacterium]